MTDKELAAIRAMHEDWIRYEGAIHGGTGTGLTNTYSYADGHRDFGEWLVDGFPSLLDEIARVTALVDGAFDAGYKAQQKHYDEMVRQFTTEIAGLARERDAAVADLEAFGHNVHTCEKSASCTMVTVDHSACCDCPSWQWRGMEGHHA